MAYYNDWRETYGSGTEYGKKLDSAAKIAAIQKLTGKGFDPLKSGSGFGKVKSADLYGYEKALKAATGKYANSGMAARAKQDQDLYYGKLLNAAYDKALNQGLYTVRQDTSPDDLKTQYEKNPIASSSRWLRVKNNLTDTDQWMEDNMASGPEGGIGGNWRRNQAAWQAGIGAVTGLLTGGPVGMVAGGLGGYASGKPAEDEYRKSPDPKTTPKSAIQRPVLMRDVARQRAAGTGVFNYTERSAQ